MIQNQPIIKAFKNRIYYIWLIFLLYTAALPPTAKALDPIMGDGSTPRVDAKSPLEQGRVLFAAGRFAEAAKLWQFAAVDFQQQGDLLNQAWSLSYLSLADQNLGNWQQAEQAIAQSLTILQQLQQKKQGNANILASALNTQGNLKLATGKGEAALQAWEDAEHIYHLAGDEFGVIGSKINQAQALQSLGLYKRTEKLLVSVNTDLKNQPDSLLKAKAWQSLGVIFQLLGNLHQSQVFLEQSLAISHRLHLEEDSHNTLFSLGNVARELHQTPDALNYYQQVAKTNNPLLRVEAQISLFSLDIENSRFKLAAALLPEIQSQLEQLPPSRMSVYATVNFSQSLYRLMKLRENELISSKQIALLLARAVQQGENLQDLRAQAYALNELGRLYFQQQQLTDALELSQKALQISQSINAGDISYQASWLVGQILKSQGDTQNAILAYDAAVKTLKSLRSDLVATNHNVQFSFQESVEPVYRELVDLLLQDHPSQRNLKQARETIEALQLAELDNFFREACLTSRPEQIDQLDQQAAVIYPIILGDRLEVILSIPGKPLASYHTVLSKTEVETTIKQLRLSLYQVFSPNTRLRLSRKMYDWLIRPAESQLTTSKIKTLAFVLDGSLRNIPMAALSDGKQYLIEKYGLAISPGMELMQTRSPKHEEMKVIIAALTKARQGFNALPAVQSEVANISTVLPTKVLLNNQFTTTTLEASFQSIPFSVLHLATHGQFSSKSDNTFVLTWDGKLNVKELSDFIKARNESTSTPLELIVLSACQTAKGDNRAILGLAGVAVRSGARSTIATLWAVNDESTAKFMVELYKNLRKLGINKAEALRQTQLTFLRNAEFEEPFYWSAFILVGNWL